MHFSSLETIIPDNNVLYMQHFDQKSGRPISLGCSKGDNCRCELSIYAFELPFSNINRFIHPHDANWRSTGKYTHGQITIYV
jgi:hypothetical protein